MSSKRSKLWSASGAVAMAIMTVSTVALALHTSVYLWRLMVFEAVGKEIRVAAAKLLAGLSLCILMAITAAVLYIRDSRRNSRRRRRLHDVREMQPERLMNSVLPLTSLGRRGPSNH
uniref:Uncharacterized protein n=1 Tax=Musa acuminata subsp. malaccensis TaxID=214687 RepID=A0A804JR90_MUSAM